MHKDLLGREIKVGDVVVVSSSSYVNVKLEVVTKINPKTIRTGSYGTCTPNAIMVVNDQLVFSGCEDKLNELIKENEKYFEYATPVIRQASSKSKYMVVLAGDPTSKEISAFVVKLPSDTESENDSSYRKFHKEKTELGLVFGRYHYVTSIHYKSKYGRNSSEGFVMKQDYSAQHRLLLRDIKDLGLESYIDQEIPLDVFKGILAPLKIDIDASKVFEV